MNANCTYCNSKRHPTERCMVGKLPKKGEIKDWREDNNDYAMGWWQGIEAYKEKNGAYVPTITIKELSYLLSLARKNMCKEFGYDSIEVSECFTEIRKQLNLRKRGRK